MWVNWYLHGPRFHRANNADPPIWKPPSYFTSARSHVCLCALVSVCVCEKCIKHALQTVKSKGQDLFLFIFRFCFLQIIKWSMVILCGASRDALSSINSIKQNVGAWNGPSRNRSPTRNSHPYNKYIKMLQDIENDDEGGYGLYLLLLFVNHTAHIYTHRHTDTGTDTHTTAAQ